MTGSNTVSVLFFIAPIGARDRARLSFRDLKSEKFAFSLENSWLATEFLIKGEEIEKRVKFGSCDELLEND